MLSLMMKMISMMLMMLSRKVNSYNQHILDISLYVEATHTKYQQTIKVSFFFFTVYDDVSVADIEDMIYMILMMLMLSLMMMLLVIF